MALKFPKRILTRSPNFATNGAVPGKTRAFNVSTLKSVISMGLGRIVPTSILHSLNIRAKSRSGLGPVGVSWVNDKHAHHPKRYLRHVVGMRVIHVGSVLLELKLVLVGLAGSDTFLTQPRHSVHPRRHQ